MDTGSVAPAPARLPRGPLLVLALGNFAIGMGSLVVAGILRLIASDLSVSVSAAGQLITVYSITYAVASPLLVIVVGRLPRKTLLLAGLAVVLAGNLLGAVAPGYTMLVVARVVSALGAALFTPLASSVAASISPPAQRGEAIGWVFGGLTVATAFGVPAGTFLGNALGWRSTLVLVAVVTAAGILAIWGVLAWNVTTPPLDLSAWARLARQPWLLAAVSVTLFQSTAQFVVFTYITPFLGHGLNLAPSSITLLLLVFGIASVAGNFAAAVASDRWGARRAVLATLIGLTLALLGLSLAPSRFVVVALCLVLWGIAGFGFNTPQQARLVQLAPPLSSALLALNASALYLGAAGGAAAGGAITAAGGLLALGFVAAAIALVAVGMLATTWTLERKPAFGAARPTQRVVTGGAR